MKFNCVKSPLIIIIGTLLIQFLDAIEMNILHNKNNPIKNLTSIKWAHAVNSQKELEETLRSNVHMIEADIVLGNLVSSLNGPQIPIMAHPPKNTSDISLDIFLTLIAEKSKNQNHIKGVKLDFKSIEVFQEAIKILKSRLPHMNNSIWLNADIVKGPVFATTMPVDSQRFLTGCKEFPTATLSLGWTTMWGKNFTEGYYSKNEINNMISAIKGNNIDHNITFAIRAGIAAQSLKHLNELVKDIGTYNNVTFTIWSSKDDYVDIDKLKKLIFHFGVDKVYLDIPQDVSDKLGLDKPIKNAAASSTFINFSIISLCMLTVSLILLRKYI